MKTALKHASADSPISYADYRFPPQVIRYAVWLYFRFPLSLRIIEEMLAARGIDASYETVRRWAMKFGAGIARRIRASALARGDKWRLDEVVITIRGKRHWLWRAVDRHGAVLDVLVQSRRDKNAAKRLMRKLLKKHGRAPRVLIPDKLRSYAAANNELGLHFEHRQHKGLNNRAENSHQPTRVREKLMRRFKSARQLQRFASTHDQVANLFMHCRYNPNARAKRNARTQAFVDRGQQRSEVQQRERFVAALKRRAVALGFNLTPTAAAPSALSAGTVSQERLSAACVHQGQPFNGHGCHQLMPTAYGLPPPQKPGRWARRLGCRARIPIAARH